MARRRFGRAPALRQGQRRETVWFDFIPVIVGLSSVGGTILFSLNAAALALRPFTVVRTRFQLFTRSDQQSASEDQLSAMGIAVVSDEASAVGVTAVPTPITEMGSDLWFVHKVLMGSFFAADATGLGNRGFPYEVDSKAMRKVDIGQDLVVVAEFSGAGLGSVMFVGGRMLVKLH